MNTQILLTISLPILLCSVVIATNLTDAEILAFEPPKEILKNIPYYLSGYDEDGAPIYVVELGKYDLRTIVENGGENAKALDIYLDQMFLSMAQNGRKSSAKQFILIADLEGFDMRQASHFPTIQLIISKFSRFEQVVGNGTMKQGWIVNANFIWERVWQLASPLLGALVNNVKVYGTNKEIWKPKLLKELPRDQLPEWYGGVAGHKPVEILGFREILLQVLKDRDQAVLG
ncbi:unnamed protein product [Allacma fusca]|uniref:CRAL-TRIO domain-containing protein n=1 Tax=Allacma fusca TaxID=39272 RepID=A0A8J2J7T5_9HEXA|nr:unnamed protein product [Allacma fusca]